MITENIIAARERKSKEEQAITICSYPDEESVLIVTEDKSYIVKLWELKKAIENVERCYK